MCAARLRQEVHLELVVVRRHIEVMAVRILEALLLLPDLMVELVLDVVADRVELRQLLRALALADVALAEILERAVFK